MWMAASLCDDCEDAFLTNSEELFFLRKDAKKAKKISFNIHKLALRSLRVGERF